MKIKSFKETDIEFKELARIDNLVNHDSIDHPEDDKRDWLIRDRNIIRDRLLLYEMTYLLELCTTVKAEAKTKELLFSHLILTQFLIQKNQDLYFSIEC